MAMYWDLGALVMPLSIFKGKTTFYHHICCLPRNSIAHQVMLIQERLSFPSLRNEIIDFLNKYEIIDVSKFSKQSWKSFVNEKIGRLNREYIINNSKKYKRLDYVSMGCEEFEIKDYFHHLNLADSRLKFRERSHCMTTCRTDYPSDIENVRAMFKCHHCDEIDSLDLHWKSCQGYKHLRENRDLNVDSDLVGYYRDIINLREQPLN